MKKESGSKKFVKSLLASVDVEVNGSRPWDIQVHNEDTYNRVLKSGALGLGESYVDGWWDCKDLDGFFFRILRGDLEKRVRNWRTVMHYLKATVFNQQKKSRSIEVAEQHYNIGNDLYERMLGRTMAYTCAYYKDTDNLDEAQDAKFDLICRKMGLKPGMRILDLGCGFGTFMKYAAEHYGVSAVGVNLSKEQVKFGREACKGLPIEFKLADYRVAELEGKFDRIISIGLTEHIGPKNYKNFLEVANKNLVDDGLFLLHTIGWKISLPVADPWIVKYIFPGGNIPSLKQLSGAMEGLFMVEDLQNFGADYDTTLVAWFHNFERTWPEIKHNYSERFYRMWVYYLLACAGMFRARQGQLWQFVLSKKGVVGGYTSVR
jgi:cyclopropane-fatty-acyl-phospholipid synthase